MKPEEPLQPEACYVPSDEVVAREIDGDILIVPIMAGVGDAEEELYGLSPTARAVWDRLDGRTPLSAIIDQMAAEYDASPGQISEDVFGLLRELLKRRIVVRAAP